MGRPITMPCTLYGVRCKENGKVYIGITQRDIKNRIYEHFYELERGFKKNASGGRRWQDDYDKYGRDAFEVYVIQKNIPADVAEEIEDEYIKKYDSTNYEKGYNSRTNKTLSAVENIVFIYGEPDAIIARKDQPCQE